MARIVSLFLLIVYLLSEFLQIPISNLRLILLVLWIGSILFVKTWRVPLILQRKKYLYFYFFFFVYFLMSTIGSNLMYGLTQSLYIVRVFIPILIYDILEKETRSTRNIIIILLIVVIIFSAYNINIFITQMGFGHGLKEDIIRRGTEDFVDTVFAFVYLLPVLVSTLVLALKKNIVESRKLLFAGGLSIIAAYLQYTLFKSFFMTAIVMSIFGIIAALFYKKGENTFKCFIKTVGLSIVTISLFLSSYGLIIQYSRENTDDTFVQRVEELKQVFTGNASMTQDVSSRNELFLISVKTFLDHPLFGVHYLKVGSVDESLVGNHSQWIDDLARFGVFAIFLFVFIYRSLKEQYKRTEMIIPIVVYVLLGFLNPITYPVVHINIFVLVPLLLTKTQLSNKTKIPIINQLQYLFQDYCSKRMS